jgi:tRNA 2-thiocytidine biosynthesis protein TtcA
MKLMLEEMERRQPGRKDTMLKALANVKPGHLAGPETFRLFRYLSGL